MSNPENLPTKDRESAWLRELSEFIVEANRNTWAADAPKIEDPQRPGYKELEYEKGDWLLRDSYTGYFKAPGMTTVYHKGRPAWTMVYGGEGMVEEHIHRTKEVFQFLKKALMQVSADLPIRGPVKFEEERLEYEFIEREMADWGFDFHIEEFSWIESIRDTVIQETLFSQDGFGGIVIHKGENGDPIYPWEF